MRVESFRLQLPLMSELRLPTILGNMTTRLALPVAMRIPKKNAERRCGPNGKARDRNWRLGGTRRSPMTCSDLAA